MKADLSRNSFDPSQDFQRVLLQQGRVLVDADWNEQAAILLHQNQLLARAIFGPYAAPPGDPGYEVVGNQDTDFDTTKKAFNQQQSLDVVDLPKDFFIGSGLYTIQGVIIQNRLIQRYTKQPFYEPAELEPGAYLVFLDVWERHVTPLEIDGINDEALLGVETAHRSQLIWQVRVQRFINAPPFAAVRNGDNLEGFIVTTEDEGTTTTTELDLTAEPDAEVIKGFFDAFLRAKAFAPVQRGTLVVSLSPTPRMEDPVSIPEAVATPPIVAEYRGTQNRLYRVEIHQGGTADDAAAPSVTFKWSRNNGSVVFPVTDFVGNVVTVGAIPGDVDRRPTEGSYVELLDEVEVLTCHISEDRFPQPRQLFRVNAVESSGESYRVELEHTDGSQADALPTEKEKNPDSRLDPKYKILRVWDHRDNGELQNGAIQVPAMKAGKPVSVPLESGLYIRFNQGIYHCGDYWLIPARAGISPQPWDSGSGESDVLHPYIDHTFAPLAAIDVTDDQVDRKQDLRLSFFDTNIRAFV